MHNVFQGNVMIVVRAEQFEQQSDCILKSVIFCN